MTLTDASPLFALSHCRWTDRHPRSAAGKRQQRLEVMLTSSERSDNTCNSCSSSGDSRPATTATAGGSRRFSSGIVSTRGAPKSFRWYNPNHRGVVMSAEAVIISGPRKGEFITVGEDQVGEPSQAIIDQLSVALRELDASVVAILEEARAWRRAVREQQEDAPRA